MFETTYSSIPMIDPQSFYLKCLTKKYYSDKRQIEIEKQITKEDQVNNMLFLHKLASIGKTAERIWVTERPHTSSATLLILSQDKDPEVRLSAAEHPQTPYFVLKRLLEDPSPDVRFGLAENTNLPVPLLETLINDENPYVADRASRTLNSMRNEKYEAIPCAC